MTSTGWTGFQGVVLSNGHHLPSSNAHQNPSSFLGSNAWLTNSGQDFNVTIANALSHNKAPSFNANAQLQEANNQFGVSQNSFTQDNINSLVNNSMVYGPTAASNSTDSNQALLAYLQSNQTPAFMSSLQNANIVNMLNQDLTANSNTAGIGALPTAFNNFLPMLQPAAQASALNTNQSTPVDVSENTSDHNLQSDEAEMSQIDGVASLPLPPKTKSKSRSASKPKFVLQLRVRFYSVHFMFFVVCLLCPSIEH